MTKFVVLEGIDGVGKTTISRHIVDLLIDDGQPALYTDGFFPPFNEIRTLLDISLEADSHYFAYVAAMVHASTQISELLRDAVVVCDRYIFSTQAYHEARGVKVIETSCLPVLAPDLSVLVTVKSEKERQSRLKNRSYVDETDRFVRHPGSFISSVENSLKRMVDIVVKNDSEDPMTIAKELASTIRRLDS